MIVIDSSALLELLLLTSKASVAEARLFQAGQTWHAPHLIDLEIAQVMRRYVVPSDGNLWNGDEALNALESMPLQRYRHTPFLPRIWALRNNLTAYDAAYVALAESLGAPLVTCDKRLAGAVGHTARIELL